MAMILHVGATEPRLPTFKSIILTNGPETAVPAKISRGRHEHSRAEGLS